MLWWLLLRNQTKRKPIGLVVDLCAQCEQLRFFRVIRLFRGSARASFNDEKWCGGCGQRSISDPRRYNRPLAEVEVADMSEQEALAASNPGLKARLAFLDELLAQEHPQLKPAHKATLQEVIGRIKRFEAQGEDTGPLLQRIRDQGALTPAGLSQLLDWLRSEDKRRVVVAHAAQSAAQAQKKVRWQGLAFGAMAGIAAALLAFLGAGKAPGPVIGGAVALAALGAVVVGFFIQARGVDRVVPFLPALALAGLGAAIVWRTQTQQLRVDNQFPGAITVFVDEQQREMEPGVLLKMYMKKKASYRLGWGFPGNAQPAETLDTPLGDNALYNPGLTSCYWLQVDVYSDDASAQPSAADGWGPVPLSEVYSFPRIDKWFADNPDEVNLSSGQRSAKRMALRRDGECMQYFNCPMAVRQSLQTCRTRALYADSDARYQRCLSEAIANCPDYEE